jgi:predicted acetyltransferase
MEIKSGYLYFIDDAFFVKVNDPFLKINYSDTSRPHYVTFLDEKTSLFWLIPCSSKIEKYKKIIEAKQANKKPTDSIKIITIQDMKCVLLFQDMFPINKNYIKEQYIRGGQAVFISNPNLVRELEKTAKKIINLLRRGIRFTPTQPNIIFIENMMKNELDICFSLPDSSFKSQYEDMMKEWLDFGGGLNPGALRNNGKPYETWRQWMDEDANENTCPPGTVPQTIYFAVRGDGKLIGAASIRHKLNERLNNDSGGGHVGYGVRPSERRKGYAKKILFLTLEKLAERGICDVIIHCDDNNMGSEKTILACGGEFVDEVINENGEKAKRLIIRKVH